MLLTLIGCQKDTVTLKARISTFSSPDKTYMEPVTDGCMPRWQNGDGIWINGNNSYAIELSGQNASINGVTVSGDYRAIYPAGIVNGTNDINSTSVEITLPRVQNYVVNGGNQIVEAPMGAWSDENTLNFTNLGALLAIKVLNNTDASLNYSASLTIDSIVVTSVTENTPLWGEAEIQNINTDSRRYVMTPSDAVNIEKYYTVSLGGVSNIIAARSTNESDAKILYMYIPASTGVTQNRFAVSVYAHSSSGTCIYTRTQEVEGQGNIGLGRVACVPMYLAACSCDYTPAQRPDGALDAVYSISNLKKVYFSRGNLRYKIANGGSFEFAVDQYHILGDNFSDLAAGTLPDEVELFGWGTSGYHDANDLYTIQRYPYSMDAHNPSGTTYNYYGYGPSINNTTGVDLSSNPSYDWGSQMDGNWRTLTKDEWDHLLNHRYTVSTDSYRKACVYLSTGETITGIVIFPDNFNLQDQICFPAPGFDDGRLTDLNYLYHINASDLDLYNIVFLPMTGTRKTTYNATTMVNKNTYTATGFYYWTASATYTGTSLTPTNKNASALTLAGGFGQVARCYGSAVRLVSDID